MASLFEHPKIDWDAADLYQEYERFRSHVGFVFAGPLSEFENKAKAGWLGTWIGEQGREIYKTLEWGNGEKEDPAKVLEKFAAYIRPRKNKRIARHRFKQRKQSPTESFDHFVKDLRIMLLDCEYADSDDMLIDAIIAGVREKRVQERLLDKGEDLTLAKALEIPQQFEMSQKQLRIVREEDTKVSAMAFSEKQSRAAHHKKSRGQFSHKQAKPMQQRETSENKANSCFKCGKDAKHPWSEGKCPAEGSTCSHCKKSNHWAAVCRSRKVSSVDVESEDSQYEDEEILGINLTQEETPVAMVADDKWRVEINILSQRVEFSIVQSGTGVLRTSEEVTCLNLSFQGITLIINATLTHMFPIYQGVECLRVPVSDLPHAPLGDHFERVAERIHSNRTGNTLVYCAAGMSRSPSLVMAYLMRYKGTTLREAHRWVQDSRPYIRPNAGFWHQLLDYEKKLYGKNTVKVAPSLESNSVKEPITWSFNRSQGRSRYCMYQ